MSYCTLEEAWNTRPTTYTNNTQKTNNIDFKRWEGFKQIENFDNYSPEKIMEISPQSQNQNQNRITEQKVVNNDQFRRVLESQPKTTQVLTTTPTFQTNMTQLSSAPIQNNQTELVLKKGKEEMKTQIDTINKRIDSIMDKLERKTDKEEEMSEKMQQIMDKMDSLNTGSSEKNVSNFNRNVHDIILFIIFGLFIILIIDGIFKLASKANKKYLVV